MSPTTYYHNKKNKCWIIHATNEITSIKFYGWDEEDVIKYICENAPYDCIGDLCMGRGLVGYHANRFGKNFVGTEINKKRLAVLLDGIETGVHKYK